MDAQERAKVITGRQAVDAYRTAHSQLHSPVWHKGIPEEHTPLINILKLELKKQGFSSLDQFFDASKLLNIEELGFASGEDFELKATEADRVLLEEKWK